MVLPLGGCGDERLTRLRKSRKSSEKKDDFYLIGTTGCYIHTFSVSILTLTLRLKFSAHNSHRTEQRVDIMLPNVFATAADFDAEGFIAARFIPLTCIQIV